MDGAVCVMGVFDGLHLGHRHLIDIAREEAEAEGRSCIAITFDVDPDDVFGRPGHKKLMRDDDRISSLAESGVDAVFVMGFDEDVATLTPEEFLDDAFGEHTPSRLYVGQDFRFGRRASGDATTLARWGKDHGMEVVPIELLEIDGEPVRSTRIRESLDEGDLDEAKRLLGHAFRFTGDVVHGANQGTEFGIKTANLRVPEAEMVLREGVYAGIARVGDRSYPSAVSVGVSPTFADERDANVEAHILDFDGDIYGQRIRIELLERLRPMIRFDDVDELVATIRNDIVRTRDVVSARLD